MTTPLISSTFAKIAPVAAAVGLVAFASAWPVQSEAPSDPYARLLARVRAGEVKIPFEPKFGYLRGVLRELNVPVASQTLVFSKTSLQSSFINRKNPRAIYFNREVYVGWIPGAPLIEIMSVDPIRGALFYTIDNTNKETLVSGPENRTCFRCHGGRSATSPSALFTQSTHVAPSGYDRIEAPLIDVETDTPIEQRWGGWYVTGSHGKLRHLGNELSIGDETKFRIDVDKGANVQDLKRYFDTTRYLTNTSDIGALLVMDHQMHVQNALSRVAMTGRSLLSAEERKQSFDALSPSKQAAVAELVRGIARLASGRRDAPLRDAVKPSASFIQAFELGYKNELEDVPASRLSLRSRLFEGPSPLMHSDTVRFMPQPVRERLVLEVKKLLN